MRLLGSTRCVKAFQKQKRTSKLIMAGVQNTRARGSDRRGGSWSNRQEPEHAEYQMPRLAFCTLFWGEPREDFKQEVVGAYWHIIKILTAIWRMDWQSPEDLGHDCNHLGGRSDKGLTGGINAVIKRSETGLGNGRRTELVGTGDCDVRGWWRENR